MKYSHKAKTDGVVAYVRSATVDASGFNSLKAQEKRIRAFARSNGLTISRVYKDNGYSGMSAISDRPGLKQLFGDAKRGEFKSITITGVDRLFRDVGLLDEAIKRVQSYGIAINQAD